MGARRSIPLTHCAGRPVRPVRPRPIALSLFLAVRSSSSLVGLLLIRVSRRPRMKALGGRRLHPVLRRDRVRVLACCAPASRHSSSTTTFSNDHTGRIPYWRGTTPDGDTLPDHQQTTALPPRQGEAGSPERLLALGLSRQALPGPERAPENRELAGAPA
jgi:hypothetical protein